MAFHSIHYLIFFPIIAVLYYVIPQSYQRILLLIASGLFYLAFVPVFIFLPVFLILLDFFSAIYIEKLKFRQKKFLFIATVTLNILPLLIFKYSGFFLENISKSTLAFNFILPLGLSFYTLQSIGYIIDVYRGSQKAEKHIGALALFIMFFPQILSGPIERASRMIPQFKELHKYDESRAAEGLLLILFGFYKKAVIADNLAVIPDRVFNGPNYYLGISLPIAAVVFAFQIYYDFSGYTDIARGSAKVLGFNLMENFNHPYFSVSIQDFWRRWHISLSSWLRDYVYIPLGGNRVGRLKKYLNILITFLISGFWHGAGWNFILWGVFNGLAIVITDIFSSIKTLSRITSIKIISIPVSFILICLGWIIFRSNSITDAFFIISHLPSNIGPLDKDLGITSYKLAALLFGSIVAIEFFPCLKIKNKPVILPKWSYWFICAFAVLAIINLGVIKSVPFIYSQF